MFLECIFDEIFILKWKQFEAILIISTVKNLSQGWFAAIARAFQLRIQHMRKIIRNNKDNKDNKEKNEIIDKDNW